MMLESTVKFKTLSLVSFSKSLFSERYVSLKAIAKPLRLVKVAV